MPTDNLKNSYTEDEKLRAAYALNLFAVSVSQIIDYNDKNVLEQEYNAILNNLNLEQMPKDDTLLDTVKTIMDTITYFRMSEGDKEIIDLEYQNKMKNAIWTAVPSVSTIFAPRKHTAIGLALTLATQVGTGYMNYRRHKAEYQLEREKEYWQLKRGAIDQLNGLQKDLFDTAWRLADKYGYPDEYRLVGNQLHEYNAILMDDNPIRRYNRLEAIKEKFSAYTPFWYQIGSTANSIYRDETIDLDVATRNLYRDYALDHFSTYERLNKFNVLRYDVLTSSWALEYVDLLDLNDDIARQKAEKLVSIAERYAGTTHKDALELCAYAYLKLNDRNNAERLFSVLVNEGYNVAINAKILSGFYIQKMQIPETATEAERQYNVLKLIVKPDDMLPLPAAGTDLENWNPGWENREEITLSGSQQIPDGEKCVYKNKNIHIQETIDCAGDLVFESCILHFREPESVCKITLTETASLKITGCEIEMHAADNDFLIDAKEVRKPILLENCEMKNCWNFIEVGSNCDVTMTNCVIADAGPGFIGGYEKGSGNVSQCKFTFQDTAPFSAKEFSNLLVRSSVITLKKLQFSESKVQGCHHIRSDTNLSWDDTIDIVKYFDYDGSVTFIDVKQCVISRAEFSGISDCISSESGTINLTIFEQCNNSIQGLRNNIEIKDCLFNYCGGNTISVLQSEIKNSQFNHCVGTVISTPLGRRISDLKICDCEFNDWKPYSHRIHKYDSLIRIHCRANNNLCSYVERCLFNGMNVRNGFLIDIDSEINVGTFVYVNDCKFLNCTTERDNREILRQLTTYDGLFGKKKEIQVLSATNCTGLDRVNQSDGSAKQFKVKITNAVGIPLGCSKFN